jgi:hypothetical protein
MRKEDIAALAQILTSFKTTINELEIALRKKEREKLDSAKRRLLSLQLQIDRAI